MSSWGSHSGLLEESVPKAVPTPTSSVQSQPKAAPIPTSPAHLYVNAAKNEVQSPTNYSSQPEGATAKCRDGTYSFSQSHRGTCSHHGGVGKWL